MISNWWTLVQIRNVCGSLQRPRPDTGCYRFVENDNNVYNDLMYRHCDTEFIIQNPKTSKSAKEWI